MDRVAQTRHRTPTGRDYDQEIPFKTKTDAAEFAKDFYDRFVFGPAPGGADIAETVAEVARRRIGEADSSFAAVSLPKLKEELLALRLEMIGTAWTYGSKDEAALAVSEATKAYLAASGRLDLWDAMGAYNLAVAEAATAGADPKRGTGRAWLTNVNFMRMELFNKWHPGRDGDAVARVVNRVHSKGLVCARLAGNSCGGGSHPVEPGARPAALRRPRFDD